MLPKVVLQHQSKGEDVSRYVGGLRGIWLWVLAWVVCLWRLNAKSSDGSTSANLLATMTRSSSERDRHSQSCFLDYFRMRVSGMSWFCKIHYLHSFLVVVWQQHDSVMYSRREGEVVLSSQRLLKTNNTCCNSNTVFKKTFYLLFMLFVIVIITRNRLGCQGSKWFHSITLLLLLARSLLKTGPWNKKRLTWQQVSTKSLCKSISQSRMSIIILEGVQ